MILWSLWSNHRSWKSLHRKSYYICYFVCLEFNCRKAYLNKKMKGKAVSLEVSHEQKGFRKVWQFLFSCWIQSEYPKPCQDSLFLFYVDVEHEDLAANIPHDLSDWIETFTPRHCSYRNINMLILKIDHQDWDLSGQHHLMLKQGIWFWQAPIGGCLHVINTSIKRNVQVENEAGVFCLISHETGQLLLLKFFF